MSMELDAGFLARLAEAVKIVGGNEAAAKVMDKSVKSLERYKSGAEAPFESLRLLAMKAGVSLDWLAGHTQNIDNKGKSDFNGMVSVPVMDITASAGNGRTVAHEKQTGVVAIDEVMVRSMGLNPRKLFVTGSNGESMYPTINSGDYLIVSNDEQDLAPGDGIYFIRLEGDVLVKRLQRLPGQKIKVSSDNKAYEPYVIEINDGIDFQILGKVKLRINIERV